MSQTVESSSEVQPDARRHVVVTGGGQGIGRAIALALADSGAAVTCLDKNVDAARKTADDAARAGGRVLAQHCDVANVDELEATLASAVESLGPVSALVANAGGAAGERTPFLELSLAGWSAMLERNLTTGFACGSVYGRYLAGQGGGSIVFVTSVSAERVEPGLAHYAAAKAGLRQLMRAMALELAPAGVRVNAVAPGMTLTPGNEQLMTAPGVLARQEQKVPLGRLGRPLDLAGAVMYLLSDQASYTTGTTVVVDGGLSL